MKKMIVLYFLTALLSACGGGGSGGNNSSSGSTNNVVDTSINNDPGLTIRPNSLTLLLTEGQKTRFVIGATANRVFPGTTNIAVVDRNGVISPNVKIDAFSQFTYDVTLEQSDKIPAGTYDGYFEVWLCKDRPDVCSQPHTGSPWRIPYHIEVKPIVVSNVTIDQIAYRKISNFVVTGQNLNSAKLIVPFCLDIKETGNPTSTQRSFSCKIVGSGSSQLTVTKENGATLYTAPMTLSNVPQVRMETNVGTFVVELNPEKAPVTVDNFLHYVESGFYVNKIFHRVISKFVIQGGGYSADMKTSATFSPIKLEVLKGLSNLRGTIAMARASDDDSATSQFFFNLVDNPYLDGCVQGFGTCSTDGYAVFGKIVSGLDVMDKIGSVPTTSVQGIPDVPVTPVIINSVVQIQ